MSLTAIGSDNVSQGTEVSPSSESRPTVERVGTTRPAAARSGLLQARGDLNAIVDPVETPTRLTPEDIRFPQITSAPQRSRSVEIAATVDRAAPLARSRVAGSPLAGPSVNGASVNDNGRSPMTGLWIRYKLSGNLADREQLILHYSNLVSSVASRISMRLPSYVDHADLVSCGMFGLIDAVEKFEIGRDAKFETYAALRIRGAILDELRSWDWVPRTVRSRTRSLERTVTELAASLHREPSKAEIAQSMEITVQEVLHLESQAASLGIVALDELLAAGDKVEHQLATSRSALAMRMDPAESFADKETRFVLTKAIGQLADRDRLILVLYYFESMTLSEIGRILGVTESRISQVHSGLMKTLRTRLSALLH